MGVVRHVGRLLDGKGTSRPADGTAPDPLVWSSGALPKRRRLVHAVRDRAFLPGPSGTWDREWITLASVTASILLELVTDGDLLVRVERMLRLRGMGTVRITKVKVGNDGADEAPDIGRRRVHW